MYCPSCGSEERQASQFCRACGTDLRTVRLSLETPDAITASAVSAREDIGRAMAARIREVEDADELKTVAEDVLPQLEKFLESPDAKRLRRMRSAVVVSAVGMGVIITNLLMAAFANTSDVQGFLGGTGLGIVTFLIGLGLLLNAFWFTRPRKQLEDRSAEARSQNQLDAGSAPQLRPGESPSFKAQTTSNLSHVAGSSVTEQTTKHLNLER